MLNLKTYNTIVFDLDGTLVDSVPDLTLALNHGLAALGFHSVKQDDVRTWVGNGSLKLVERSLKHLGQDEGNNVARLHKCFLTAYEQFLCVESNLYTGVFELLERLHEEGKTLVLLTNKPIQFVPDLLTHMGVGHFFSLILGGDSLSEKKPNPLPLLHVLDTLKIEARQCLMVGDSRSDIVCAQQAGIDSVALLQGYHQGVDLAALKPTYLFDDVHSLASAII